MLTSKKSLFDDYGVSKPQKSVDPQARRLQLEKEFFEASDNLRRKTEALLEIKRDKLYRQVCETWEEYCEQVFGRSVSSLYRQFKMLEISEEISKSQEAKNRSNGTIPSLSEKDLGKMARLPDREVKKLLNDEPEVISKKIADKKARKPPEFRKAVPTFKGLTPEEEAAELLTNIIIRIRSNRENLKFLRALAEWLEESGL